MKKIVIDTQLSDKGEEEMILGAIQARREHPNYKMVVVGTQSIIEKVLEERGEKKEDYEIIDSPALPESIHDPMSLLRFKDRCSIFSSFESLNQDEDTVGLVTAGPTGMVFVSAIRRLGLVEGVMHPALAGLLYDYKFNRICLVDCGANVDATSEKLVQFAQLGSALMSAYLNKDNPRVGLLNVGTEDTKGDKLRKETFELLKNSDLNFIGNIEGCDPFLGKCDVIVADGFSGNVLLKNAEAVGMICRGIAKMNDVSDPNVKKISDTIYSLFGYTEQGGAIILGTKKIVYKAHGAANAKSIASIVSDIVALSENHFIEKISKGIQSQNQE